MQDLVSQISGVSLDAGFAKGLVGSETLKITVDMSAASITKKKLEIIRKYRLATYKANFVRIDFIAPIKEKDMIAELDNELLKIPDWAVSNNDAEGLSIAYPEIIDDFRIDPIRYGGFGSLKKFNIPHMGAFLKEYLEPGYTCLEHSLGELFVDVYDESDDDKKKNYNFHRALISEVEYNKKYSILANGLWFKLEKSYFGAVNRFFDELISSPAEYDGSQTTLSGTGPDFFSGFLLPGYEPMDLVNYRKGGDQIEFADMIINEREIINVQVGDSSSKLSRLFNKYLVSIKLMLNDVGFRKDFKNRIQGKSISKMIDLKKFYFSDYTVVFRIMRSGKKIHLPFFSKIILYDTPKKITVMGYKFRLEWLMYGVLSRSICTVFSRTPLIF